MSFSDAGGSAHAVEVMGRLCSVPRTEWEKGMLQKIADKLMRCLSGRALLQAACGRQRRAATSSTRLAKSDGMLQKKW